MAETLIEWARYVFNLWWGCDEVGDPESETGIDPACNGCYARVRAENPYWWGKQTIFPVWGQDVGRRFFTEQHYLEPLKWNRKAEKAGIPERVFCMSMGDWAEGRRDQREYLDRYLFPMIEQTPWLIWLLLTKRPQIATTIVPEYWQRNGWPKNAWPGVTAVTQKWWDLRVPALMEIPAAHHFVSAEPLMEQIDMSRAPLPSWVIAGGQSGAKAKPTHPDHFQSLRDQCVSNGLAFHFKQWGEFGAVTVDDRHGKIQPNERKEAWVHPDGSVTTDRSEIRDFAWPMVRVGKKAAGRQLDGRTWDEFPEVRA